jgi:hypothetical protein
MTFLAEVAGLAKHQPSNATGGPWFLKLECFSKFPWPSLASPEGAGLNALGGPR